MRDCGLVPFALHPVLPPAFSLLVFSITCELFFRYTPARSEITPFLPFTSAPFCHLPKTTNSRHFVFLHSHTLLRKPFLHPPSFSATSAHLPKNRGYTYPDFGIQLHSGTIYPRCAVASSSFSALPAAGGLFNLNAVH